MRDKNDVCVFVCARIKERYELVGEYLWDLIIY